MPLNWKAEKDDVTMADDLFNRLMDSPELMTDNGGFKTSLLNKVARDMTAHWGTEVTARTIMNKVAERKRLWRAWCEHLKHISGWTHIEGEAPSNTDEVEEVHYREHRECKPFRRQLPDQFEQLEVIWGERIAIGHDAEEAADINSEDSDSESSSLDNQSQSQQPATPATPAPRNSRSESSSRGRTGRVQKRRQHRGGGDSSSPAMALEAAQLQRAIQSVAAARVASSETPLMRAMSRLWSFKPFEELSEAEQYQINQKVLKKDVDEQEMVIRMPDKALEYWIKAKKEELQLQSEPAAAPPPLPSMELLPSSQRQYSHQELANYPQSQPAVLNYSQGFSRW